MKSFTKLTMPSPLKKLFLASLLFASLARADGLDLGTFSGDFKIEHQDMVANFDPAQSAYVLNQVSTSVSGAIESTGSFEKLGQDYKGKFAQVPGQQIGGSVTMKLNLSSSPATLEVAIVINDTIQKYSAQSQSKFELPVTIKEGTAEGYQNGESIVLETLPEASAIFADSMKTGLSELLNHALSHGIENFTIDSHVDRVQLNSPIQIQATQKQLRIQDIDSLYSVGVDVGM